LWGRKGRVHTRPAELRLGLWLGLRLGLITAVLSLGRHHERSRRWLSECRLDTWRRVAWRRGRCGRRHDNDPIEPRRVREFHLARRCDVATDGPQQHVQRVLFGHVGQFERDQSARHTIAVDDLCLAHAFPLSQNLSERCVLRHE